ncbi:hypothetical protein ACFL0H_08020 [Thermodesulfobacteriota bacterium]
MAVRHKIRTWGNKTRVVTLTARQAIIEHCKECIGFNTAEVRRCTSPLCALFPFKTRDTPQNTVETLQCDNMGNENRISQGNA